MELVCHPASAGLSLPQITSAWCEATCVVEGLGLDVCDFGGKGPAATKLCECTVQQKTSLSSLLSEQLDLVRVDIVGNTQDELVLEVLVQLSPLARLSSDLQQTRLEVFKEGASVGYLQPAQTAARRDDDLVVFEGHLFRTNLAGDAEGAISALLSDYLIGADSEVTLRSEQGHLVLDQITFPGVDANEALIQYGATTMPLDIQWNAVGDYVYSDICGDTENNLGLEFTLMLKNPLSTPLHVESGTLSVSMEDFPGWELFFDQLYMFSPPYDNVEKIGFIDWQGPVTLDPNVENPSQAAYLNGVAPVTQVMCLDGIMDCGCSYVPGNEFMSAAGCPAVSLINYFENQMGAGPPEVFPGSDRLDKAGTPGNGVMKVDAENLVVSFGNCILDADGLPTDEDPENDLYCFKRLPLALSQSGVNLALAVDSYANSNDRLCL